jgi:hypothetical protein
MEYRDVHYEQLNIGYNSQYPEGGIKCKNYELCEAILPIRWYECKARYLCSNYNAILPMWIYEHKIIYLCSSCTLFGWGELEIKENKDECDICNEENNKYVKFPTNCGHSFCTVCTRNILLYDEKRYHLSPVPFGCPPCPNKCANPIKGKQCYCKNYIKILDQWRKAYPEKYDEYNSELIASIQLSETIPGSVYGSQECPMCRKKYKKPN